MAAMPGMRLGSSRRCATPAMKSTSAGATGTWARSSAHFRIDRYASKRLLASSVPRAGQATRTMRSTFTLRMRSRPISSPSAFFCAASAFSAWAWPCASRSLTKSPGNWSKRKSSSAASSSLARPAARASTSATRPPRECVTRCSRAPGGQRRASVSALSIGLARSVAWSSAKTWPLYCSNSVRTRCGCVCQSLPKPLTVSEKVPWTNTSVGPPSGATGMVSPTGAWPFSGASRSGLSA